MRVGLLHSIKAEMDGFLGVGSAAQLITWRTQGQFRMCHPIRYNCEHSRLSIDAMYDVLQFYSLLGVYAVASGFNSMLQCFMWPVVCLYEGGPYGWPAWGCVTPVHQGRVLHGLE